MSFPPRMYVPFAIRFQQIRNQGILKLKEAISLWAIFPDCSLNWWFSLALMSHHRQYGEYVLTGESDGNVDGEETMATERSIFESQLCHYLLCDFSYVSPTLLTYKMGRNKVCFLPFTGLH